MHRNSEGPKVTIGITSYNSEKTIARAIKNALKQDWRNKEIIIIDDASSDSSEVKIMNAIKGKDIKLIKNKKNRGASYSRNKIIKNSRGELICFMDDDDYSDSQRVKKQVKQIMESGFPKKKFIACCTGLKKVYKNGHSKILYPLGTTGRAPIRNELANFLLFYERKKGVDYGFALPTCCLMITRNCFKKFGYFDLNLKRVEDMDYTIRLSFGDTIFTSVKEILVTQTANTFSKKLSYKNYNAEITLIKKYSDYLSNKKLFEYSMTWPELRFNYFQFKYKKCFFILIKTFYKYPKRAIPHFLDTAFKRLIHDIKNDSISFKKLFK